MSANKFTLTHHHVEVDYTIGITPGLIALTYKDGATVKSFKSDEITTTSTPLGSMVSVRLLLTVDTGGEVFAFFLPELEVAAGQTAEFTTVGIYDKFGGPDSVPRVPPEWRCIELRGQAESVIVPL